jgi:hypothetical protein
MWKLLYDSVAGSSHEEVGTPCQDHSFATCHQGTHGEALILACADGAGSAVAAERGARLACEFIVSHITKYLDSGRGVDEINRELMQEWYGDAHLRLNDEAVQQGLAPRDLASTLLLAVVTEGVSVFAQIGDGAIVYREGPEYQLAFWPQSGDYANTTYFLTEPTFSERLAFRQVIGNVNDIAIVSDGLQMLALNYAAKSVHAPFFEPLFRSLRQAASPDDLVVPLRQFLNSEGILNRTDDDKTLMLATRASHSNESV